MARVLSHDPFARFELRRETVFLAMPHAKSWNTRTCAWCGSYKSTKSGRPFLYCYSTQSDGFGARTNTLSGEFCSKGCMQSFHGFEE